MAYQASEGTNISPVMREESSHDPHEVAIRLQEPNTQRYDIRNRL